MTDRTRIRVAVASGNPVKLRATEQAFHRAFPEADITLDGVSVGSGVSDQPMSDEETLTGARTRAQRLRERFPDHDFVVGIEGGIEHRDGGLDAFAWVVIIHADREGRSRSCSFQLPEEVTGLVRDGMELGHANDMIFRTENSKHEQGAVGILTHGLIDRTALYAPAVILALVPFLDAFSFARRAD